jgi:RsiW-degrading membrane proteinase PrsW (M82 family)
MAATPGESSQPAWRWLVPRWLQAWLLVAGLTGLTLLVAQLTNNWTIVPTAVFLGAMSGPFAFATWVTDRTRVGRSVAPEVLFTTWLVGGGVAIVFVGIFESDFFHRPIGGGFLWIGVVEESAKVVAPLAIYTFVRKYRSVPQALAFAVVTASGFAVFESMTYALSALDESVRAARRVLFERSLITPFGHVPWTGIAVVVAAREWQAAGRIRPTPRALWGIGAAIALHTTWNIALVEGGWWNLDVPVVAVATFMLFRHILAGVYYDGPYVASAKRDVRGWRTRAIERRRPPP